MCRNIRPLFNFEPPTTEEEIHQAALQFVRKISGTTRPSKANEAAFETAVEEVTASVRRMLATMTTQAPARNRELEAEKAKARSQARFGT